jgi:predicted DNA-binding WGR domain protein
LKIVERWRICIVTVVRPDLSQAIESARLICIDTAQNSNKQWTGWLMPNGDLYVEYGRIGYTQKPYLYRCLAVRAAQLKLHSLMQEKYRKGYRQVSIEEAPAALDLSFLESSEAQAMQRRLERLQQQAEVIGQFANISFDITQGIFSTHMGMLSQRAIAQARYALQRIEACLTENGNGTSSFEAAVEDYLAVIPLKVGMTLNPRQILGRMPQVQGQSRLLNELALCLSEVKEIRDGIREALGVAVLGGSDERARWLQWGQSQEESEVTTPCHTGDPLRVYPGGRAQWSRWELEPSGE